MSDKSSTAEVAAALADNASTEGRKDSPLMPRHRESRLASAPHRRRQQSLQTLVEGEVSECPAAPDRPQAPIGSRRQSFSRNTPNAEAVKAAAAKVKAGLAAVNVAQAVGTVPKNKR